MSAPLFRLGVPGVLALLAAAVAAAGCGSGDGLARQAVSGSVTLDGAPLASATITFVRTEPGAPDVAGGIVHNGRFSIARSSGPAAGHHEVRISSMALGQDNPDTTPGAPSKISRETLPEKYNSATILDATIQAGQPNELQFNLDTD